MKRLFTILFMFLSVIANAFTGEVEIDGIYYNIVTKGKVAEVISKPGGYTGIVNIPASVTYDGVECSVTSISDWAFSGCGDLISVTVPNSVTSIGSYAFHNCTSMTSVTLGDNLKTIGFCAFQDCSALTSIAIPNSVTSIKSYAFIRCSGLTSITIPDSITCLEDFIFEDCSNLTSITLSRSITSIKREVFKGCSSLVSIVIPNNVTSIGYRAFEDCKRLKSVVLGNNLIEIGESAFNGCISLIDISLPKSIVSIGISAFEGCANLDYISIPDGVTYIKQNTFYGCNSLKQIIIGSGITSISEKAFAQCSDVTDVYCLAQTVPTTSANVFQDSYIEYAMLHVPTDLIDTYKAKEPWKSFKEIKSMTGEEIPVKPNPEEPEVNKCATPTIQYENGVLKFLCSTDDVTYHYTLADADICSGTGNNIILGVTYTITVYATRDGYEESDVATATLCWIDAEPKSEGIVDEVSQVRANTVLISTKDGQINISGLDDSTSVSVYTVNGMLAESDISKNGTAIINPNLPSGSIAIVKIGSRSIKTVIK